MPSFTVVIPVFQTQEILRLFLESLVQSLTQDTELILVNDGSGTEVQRTLERFQNQMAAEQVLVLENRVNQGAARAINRALSNVNPYCDYIVFLDSDTILHHGWQDKLLPCFSDPDVGAVGGMLLYPQSGGVQCCGITYCGSVGRHLYLNANPDNFPVYQPYDVQATVFAFCSVRRDIAERLGLLDEQFFNGYEDLDYQFRLRKMGYRILTNPDIRLYHWEKSNGSHRSFNQKSNLGRFWQKHGDFVHDDLTKFLQLSLNGCPRSVGSYHAIDFCEGRGEANAVRHWLNSSDDIALDGWEDASFACNAHDTIWLPEVLGSGSIHNRAPYLFLCDQMIQLLDNQYWWTLRSKYLTEDIIIDLYGNALPFSWLQQSFWPGRKIR